MGSTHCVGKVVIFNRVDCCQERLTGAIVRIGSNSKKAKNAVCGTVTDSMIEESWMLNMTCAIQGRYISIHLNTEEYLTLCEVQAYAGRCSEW